MTTFVLFAPIADVAFTFTAILDTDPYKIVISWNVYGQRWYVNIYDTSETLILCMAMIGSTDTYDFSLTAGYFNSTFIYRISTNQFEISP